MNNRKTIIVSSVFLLLALAGAVFFYHDARDTLQALKTDQATSREFSQLVPMQPAVKNILFADIISDPENHIVIDIREPEEYNEGRIKGSLHYRLGELLNSIEARQDLIQQTEGKNRVFYCHDGDRSRLAATVIYNEFGGENFIMEKGFWQIQDNDEYKRYWAGSTNILPKEKDYKRTPPVKWKDLTVDTLIDLSLQNKPPLRQLRGKTVIHAPVLLMSSKQIEAFINTLGAEPVVAMCNSKVSCFSTRILRYRLEEKGLELAGFVRFKETKIFK
jgi:rhodanese-related sulfurtransferase